MQLDAFRYSITGYEYTFTNFYESINQMANKLCKMEVSSDNFNRNGSKEQRATLVQENTKRPKAIEVALL